MNQSATATEKRTEFGADQLLVGAQAYREAKRIVDAAAKYENVEDAISALKSVWAVLENQAENGQGYTPDIALGFGSNNATQIADQILGRSQSVGATRKAFADMGK